MKKLLLILLCLPFIGFGQENNSQEKKLKKKLKLSIDLIEEIDLNKPFTVYCECRNETEAKLKVENSFKKELMKNGFKIQDYNTENQGSKVKVLFFVKVEKKPIITFPETGYLFEIKNENEIWINEKLDDGSIKLKGFININPSRQRNYMGYFGRATYVKNTNSVEYIVKELKKKINEQITDSLE
jgi:hypothetical protein